MSETGKTPLAVALRYEAPGVPKVVAVGRGDLGLRIIETAREHGVPLEVNPVLAEALSTIEVESDIPPELYMAMATVLAFIMRASTKATAAPLRP